MTTQVWQNHQPCVLPQAGTESSTQASLTVSFLSGVHRHLFVLFQSHILTEQKHPTTKFHQSKQNCIRFPSWQGLEFCNLLLTINASDDKSSFYIENFVISWFCKAMAVLTQLLASTQLSATELGSSVCPQLISQLTSVHRGKTCQFELIQIHPNFERTGMKTALGGPTLTMLYLFLVQKYLNRETPWTGRTKCCFFVLKMLKQGRFSKQNTRSINTSTDF